MEKGSGFHFGIIGSRGDPWQVANVLRSAGRALLPAGSLIAGAGLWGCYWWPLAYFTREGFGGPWLAATTYLLAAGGGSALLAWRGGTRGWQKRRRTVFLLALLGGWTNVAFTLALLHGSVAQVLLLFYLSPAWATIFSRLFLKERTGTAGVLSVLLAITGSGMVILHNQTALSSSSWHSGLLAISSGIAFALINVVLRGEKELGDLQRSVAIWWGCALVALVFSAFAPWPANPGWGAALVPAFAWLWIGGATASTVYGVSRLPVTVSAVIMPIEILFGAVSAWILAGQELGWWDLAGGALILGAPLVHLLGKGIQTAGEQAA